MGFVRKELGKIVYDAVEAMDEIVLNGQVELEKTSAYTMTAADSGKITRVTGTTTITLPATVVGMKFKILNGNEDGVAVTISPNASDKIIGNGFTAADDKDAINTAATAKYGDFFEILGDGVDGWYVQAVKGTWARQA